jgi:hypothetical protein
LRWVQMTKMEDCQKFDRCNAPICPLDEKRADRTYIAKEPICLWMREVGKVGGVERMAAVIPGPVGEEIIAMARLASSEAPLSLQASLRASWRTGSILRPTFGGQP